MGRSAGRGRLGALAVLLALLLSVCMCPPAMAADSACQANEAAPQNNEFNPTIRHLQLTSDGAVDQNDNTKLLNIHLSTCLVLGPVSASGTQPVPTIMPVNRNFALIGPDERLVDANGTLTSLPVPAPGAVSSQEQHSTFILTGDYADADKSQFSVLAQYTTVSPGTTAAVLLTPEHASPPVPIGSTIPTDKPAIFDGRACLAEVAPDHDPVVRDVTVIAWQNSNGIPFYRVLGCVASQKFDHFTYVSVDYFLLDAKDQCVPTLPDGQATSVTTRMNGTAMNGTAKIVHVASVDFGPWDGVAFPIVNGSPTKLPEIAAVLVSLRYTGCTGEGPDTCVEATISGDQTYCGSLSAYGFRVEPRFIRNDKEYPG